MTEIVLLATQQDSSCTLSANNVTTMQDTRTSSYVMQSHRRAASPCEYIGDGRADYVMFEASADGRRYLRLYRLIQYSLILFYSTANNTNPWSIADSFDEDAPLTDILWEQ